VSLELNQQQQDSFNLLKSNVGLGESVRSLKQNQINGMIEAARLLGTTRGSGLTDDQAIVALARALVREDDRRLRKDPELSGARAQQAEAELNRLGYAMDESDMKGSGQILREDNENMGYSDYAEYEAAQREGKAALQLDENLLNARERFKKAQGWLASKPRDSRAQAFYEKTSAQLERAEAAARDYSFGMTEYAAEGEDTRPGALEDQMLRERQRRATRKGKAGVVQGGRFYADAEDAPVPVKGALEPKVGRGFTPEDRALSERRSRLQEFIEGQSAKAQEERFFRGDLTEREMAERARLEAGRITPTPDVVRLEGRPQQVTLESAGGGGFDVRKDKTSQLIYPLGDGGISGIVKGTPVVGNPENKGYRPDPVTGVNTYREFISSSPTGVNVREFTEDKPQPFVQDYHREWYDEDVRMSPSDRMDFDVRPQQKVGRRGIGAPLDAGEVGESILAQLRARKERGRSGTVDRIMQRNNLQAAAEGANLFHTGGGMEAKERLSGLPNIAVLGQLKGDKLKRDMGLQLGNQRVSFPEAVRYQREDGSYEYYDKDDVVLGDLSYNDRPLPGQAGGTTSETINAPITGETAEGFVERNIYDNYGAQFFGDENIVANLADTGSGGGIPQVSISGELGALEDAVAKKTGVRKGIRSIASLQAAADAVIAAEKTKGNVLFTMQDGKKVASANPGLAEAMWALKIPPAQQQAIANSLYQLEAARSTGVDLDQKDTFFSGGTGRRTAWDGKAIITGVNDPGRGGDRLEIQKADGRFQAALRSEGGLGRISPDAAKPFVAALGDDPPARTIQNNAQVYRGMDPVEVRLYQERQSRINAAKRKKAGKDPVPMDVGRTRAMQEGNIMANFREMQAKASRDAQDRVMLGEVRPGRPVPAALKGDMVQLPGTLPTAPAKDARLLARPTRDTSGEYRYPVRRPMEGSSKPGPGKLTAEEAKKRRFSSTKRPSAAMNPNPTVESYPTIELPAGYKDRQATPTREERVNSILDKVKNVTSVDPRNLPSFGDFRTKPEYQRGRRISYATGGLAGIAAALGLSNMGEEEEQRY